MHGYLLILFSEIGSVKLPLILYLFFMSFLLVAQYCKKLGNSQEMLSMFKVCKNQRNLRSLMGLRYHTKSDGQSAMGFPFKSDTFVKLNVLCFIMHYATCCSIHMHT